MNAFGMLIFILVLFVGISFGAVQLDKYKCYSAWSDYETQWGFMTGCRIKHNGLWVPAKNFREFD